MSWIDLLQWPAVALTVLGAWFVGSQRAWRRGVGFWTYLGSNLMWIVWGLSAATYGVVALQVFLVALNIRGMVKVQRERDA